ncbi:hypothetical protein IT087_00780 [Candidatus Uhrbacteria bacterium]|nr:hypothetical protein [Candidatus Uhrbacteria bacterium]
MNTNSALYISISFALALVSGCAPIGVYSTSTGHGSSSPFHREHSSSAETYTCMDVRDAQDDETTEEAFSLLERVGLIPSAHDTTVNFRDAARLLCEQEARRGEEREVPAEVCERWLADDGIPADATGTVTSTERLGVDRRVEDMVLPIAQARLYFGLFMADAQRYCQDREASTVLLSGGAPASGFALFAPVGAMAGTSYFGGLGGGFGLGLGTAGGATTVASENIVLDTRFMSPSVTAVVSIISIPAAGSGRVAPTAPGTLTLTSMSGQTPVAVLDGFDYQVTVQCLVNGALMTSFSHTSRFSSPTATGGRVELDVICGRS